MDSSFKACVYLLPGETVNHDEPIVDGRLIFTDYRLVIVAAPPGNIWSVPIALLWKAETVNLTFLKLTTKLALSVMCAFDAETTCERCAERIVTLIDTASSVDNAFCYTFRDALRKGIPDHPFLYGVSRLLWNDEYTRPESEFIFREFKRMHFQGSWKISEANRGFKICPTYPEYHIVPFGIQDSAVVNMAEFRTHRRFPSVVWRSQVTGAVLLRCAQPCVGLMFYRNQCDEQFMASVSKSCRENPGSKQIPGPTRLLIVDARTYRVAQLKRLLGGGSEHPDYYDQAQVCFMNMPNVHAVRLSFERLTQLYTLDTDVSWYSMLEKTCWLNYIAQLIKSALDIAFALEVDGRPVMVHCTDGWDRTAQLSSLAQLLADPYYRTVEGFVVLVEREWLYFGHKFADRCGQGGCNAYPDERSPIFLQWLDCVHQVRRQFPNYFEFSETFLVKLGLHIYSGLFGTFLGNSEENRQTVKLNARTCSVWALLSPRLNRRVINPFYEPGNQRLIVPSCSLPNLCLWDNLYRHALFPASKNVMGIVCLNEPRSAVVINGPSEPSDFNTADQSTVTDSDNSSGLIPVESNEIREIAAHDEASEILPPATAHIDESLFNNLCTNPELDTRVHRNFLGDLTNTATHTGCCLSPLSMDGNLDTEPKQFVFPVPDPSSSITAKKKLDGAPLDNTVAILPLSSVTKSPSDWYFSSSLRKSYCSHSSLNGVNEAIPHLNGVHLCDVSDLSKQCAVCVSVPSKRLSFSEDCNDVFVADEETPSTTDRHMKSVKECCPHSGLAPEKSLESDDQDVDEHDTSVCCLHSGIVAQTQSTSTPPVNIGSNSYLSIRTHGEVRSTKRLSRCRTPSDNHSFVSFGSIESQRTPVSTVRRKSLESLGRVVCTPDTEDPSDNSDFTVHSLPEGELLITETSFSSEEANVSRDITAHTVDQTDDGFLMTGAKDSDPSGHCIPSGQCRDLSIFVSAYFTLLHVASKSTSKKSCGMSTVVIEAPDPSGLIRLNDSRLCCGTDRENALRPVSAPISPTLDTDVKPGAYFAKAQSTGQSCNSPTLVSSQVSSTPTLQSVAVNVALSKAIRCPDWDGFPTLETQVTTCVHTEDPSRCVTQQSTIDRLDEELRIVRRELDLQRQETESLRQQLSAFQTPLTVPKKILSSVDPTSVVQKAGLLSAVVHKNGNFPIRPLTVDSPTNGIASQTRIEPAMLEMIEDNEETECAFWGPVPDLLPESTQMFSSIHLDASDGTADENLAHCLTKALNDSITEGSLVNHISSYESSRNRTPAFPTSQLPAFIPLTSSLFSAVSANDLTVHPRAAIPAPTGSRCRSAGAPRTTTSSATSDGMAQA